MKGLVIAVFVFLPVLVACAKQLPTYVVPCKKNDPNLNACAKQHAIEALPHLLKGNANFKIPSLLTFHISLVDVKPADGLSFKLKNIKLYGLESASIQDIQIDLQKQHMYVKLFMPHTVTISEYEVDGKVLSLAVQGNGPANITLDNATAECSFDYQLIKKKDGREYIDVNSIKPEITYKQEKVHYEFGNLFNGDKLLGDNFNKFLNENADEVDSIAAVSTREIIIAIFITVFNAIVRVVPYHELFT